MNRENKKQVQDFITNQLVEGKEARVTLQMAGVTRRTELTQYIDDLLSEANSNAEIGQRIEKVDVYDGFIIYLED